MPSKDPSKTEKATAKRRRKQRENANVAKSGEVSKAMVLLTAVITLRFLIDFYHDEFREIYQWTFSEALTMEVNKATAYSLFVFALKEITILVLPFMLCIAFVAWLTMRLQVGALWTTKHMKFQLGKQFNIMRGIKKLMLDPKAFVKFFRSLVQAIVVGVAPYIVLQQEMNNLLPLFHSNTYGIISYLLEVGYRMTCYALIPMIIIAALDLWYTRWSYEEGIKMTKDEVKDERKQAEGDPKIKAQQQKKMMAMMASRMFQDVPKADVVITNPTHYAVALQYDVMVAPAPLILAKGVDRVAERIKEIARENLIPIEANPPLARALYRQVEIGETIPEELYQAVAAILAKIDKFKKG